MEVGRERFENSLPCHSLQWIEKYCCGKTNKTHIRHFLIITQHQICERQTDNNRYEARLTSRSLSLSLQKHACVVAGADDVRVIDRRRGLGCSWSG